MESAVRFRKRLIGQGGLNSRTVDMAWPDWWSEEADASVSAQAELRFSVARKLGIDPASLMNDEDQPRFLWIDQSKFKHLAAHDERAQPALSAFGGAIARMLFAASPQPSQELATDALSIRKAILTQSQFVTLQNLLALCWGLDIPVIHLQTYPLDAKRMCAMTTRFKDRHAILLAKNSVFPAMTAFHLAHELGHILLRHLAGQSALIDLDDPVNKADNANDDLQDDEETAADRFALTVLTGHEQFNVVRIGNGGDARQLAKISLDMAGSRIEPGTFALCYAYSTGDWPAAMAALPLIYAEQKPVWLEVNRFAMTNLAMEYLPTDQRAFLRAVMGAV